MTGICDVLIRCDGGATIGLGHVKRCLALSHALHRRDLAVTFAGRFDASARALLAAAAPCIDWEPGTDEAHWLADVIAQTHARALVLDIRTALAKEAVAEARAQGVVTLLIDDISERRLAGDFVTLPPTVEAERASWAGFSGEKLIGWNWVILSGRVPRAAPDLQSRGEPPLRVLITMGGADPLRLTERAAKALEPHKTRLTPTIVIGPAFADSDARANALRMAWPGARLVMKPADLGDVVAHTDLALVSYGVTAQELAAAGVPALYLCLSEDHVSAARALAATGAGVSLGRHDAIDDADLDQAVAALIADPARRAAMASAGPRAIDGHGAERIAEKLGAHLGLAPARTLGN